MERSFEVLGQNLLVGVRRPGERQEKPALMHTYIFIFTVLQPRLLGVRSALPLPIKLMVVLMCITSL